MFYFLAIKRLDRTQSDEKMNIKANIQQSRRVIALICENIPPSVSGGRRTFGLPIKGTLKTLEQMCLIDSLRSLLMV